MEAIFGPIDARSKPEVAHRHRGDDVEPLLVRPRVAWKMLACGNTRGYELLAAGELESFLDGGARKITVASIHRYIERRLEQGSSLQNSEGR
jgi:hypothetical protein